MYKTLGKYNSVFIIIFFVNNIIINDRKRKAYHQIMVINRTIS